MKTKSLPVNDLRTLLPSWQRSLRASNRAPRTVETYTLAVEQLIAFLRDSGMPLEASAITREHVESFIEHVLETRSDQTARQRFASLQQLFNWLVEEGEIKTSPMARMKPPAVPEKPVRVIPDDDVKKLLKACDGKSFEQLRDTAIIRVLLDTGVRLAEIAGMQLDDADLDVGEVTVLGKGRRLRTVSVGTKTVVALDRYLRARRRHPRASEKALWISAKGALTPSGLRQMLWRRSEQAGIERVHPHAFRHRFAHHWLSEGGQEHDLMQLAGWKSRQMLARYGSSAAAERARQAHKRLSPGDKF